VELVAVPAAGRAPARAGRLVDAELREPLADQEEVAGEAGARVDLGQHGRELDLDHDLAAGRDRCRQRHPQHRAVFGVAVVGGLEGRPGEQVGAVGEPHRSDVDPPPVVLLGLVAPQPAARFAEEGALAVAEGVEVEVEPELGDGVARRIAPGQRLATFERLLLGIEPDRDAVVDDPLGALGEGVGDDGAGGEGRERQGQGDPVPGQAGEP